MRFGLKLARSSITAVVALALIASGPQIASATTNAEAEADNLTDAERSYLQESLDELGISEEIRNQLIDKVDAGEPLDSWTLTNAIDETEWVEDGFRHSMVTFADGSRSLTSVQIPDENDEGSGIGTRATSVCTLPSGPYPNGQPFSGCTIKRNSGGMSMHFNINGRTRGPSTGNASITSMSPVRCSMLASTNERGARYIGQAKGKTAWSEGTCTFTLTGGAGTVTYGIRASVTNVIRATEF